MKNNIMVLQPSRIQGVTLGCCSFSPPGYKSLDDSSRTTIYVLHFSCSPKGLDCNSPGQRPGYRAQIERSLRMQPRKAAKGCRSLDCNCSPSGCVGVVGLTQGVA